jgi:hypothetical protein
LVFLFLLPLVGLALCGPLEAGRWGYAACFGASFVGLAWLVRRLPAAAPSGRMTVLALVVGLALRVLFVWAWPADSDSNRYIVEGSLQWAGANPYRLAPGDPAVAGLISEAARAVLSGVNHPELAAAYPPLAEAYCRVVAAVSPTPFGFKAAAALVDMGVCVVLAAVLGRLRMPAKLLWLYAANPLVLTMAAGEGHLDVVMVLGVALALCAFAGNRPGFGFFWLGVAAMVKYPAAVLIPFFFSGQSTRKALWALVPLISFGCYAGAGWSLFSSLAAFAGYVSHGGPLVALLQPVLGSLAPGVALGAGAVLLAVVWLTIQDPRRGALAGLGIALAFLPTVYPWYFLPLVPLWLVRPGWSWGWLLAAQGLVTTPTWLRGAGLGGEGWAMAAVWLPFLCLTLLGWRRPGFALFQKRFDGVRTLSVVVPTLNESARLGRCLEALALAGPRIAEVLVVDGGSDDATVSVAGEHGAPVLVAGGGRGGQIAAGVAACRSDVVLVLHADAVCRADVAGRILRALNDCPEAVGGAVGMDFSEKGARLGALSLLNALRAGMTGISFGDQGQFFRRTVLETAGGFPAMALMEDVELSLRLRSLGETLVLGGGLTVSGRRWAGQGYFAKMAAVFGLFISFLAARRLGLADPSGRRYYKRYYGRMPHQTAL